MEIDVGEARVNRVLGLVPDLIDGAQIDGLRVLDLGAHQGGFAVALAAHGATVVAIEGRGANIELAGVAARRHGVEDRLDMIHADVRRLDPAALGRFDVVLCLGLLYHLPARDLPRVIDLLAATTERVAIIETQVALSSRTSFEHGLRRYHGKLYAEDTRRAGASLDNPTSFWPTKPSLVNMLTAAGFTSVMECLAPVIPPLAAYRDHITLAAFPHRDARPRGAVESWPERLPAMAHPSQSWLYWLRDRLARRRGRGLPQILGVANRNR